MAAATQPLPEASTTELPPGNAFAATGLPDVPVWVGPASKGPINVPTSFNAGDVTGLVTTFGTGLTVKECARAVTAVASPFVFERVTTASVAGVVPASASATLNGSSTITSRVLSGTPTDGADVLITFTIGGTTGTSATYTVSTDGGATTGTPIALSTGLTIVVKGVTLTLITNKVITAGDTVYWLQTAASSKVLPVTVTRVASSTFSPSVAGSPNDAYEVLVQFQGPSTATIGSALAGFQFRYALDGGASNGSQTFTAWANLGAASTITLNDGPTSTEPTGLVLTIDSSTGTVDPGDTISFATTSPTYDASGITSGLAALKIWKGGVWTWTRIVGPTTAAIAATIDGLITAWDNVNLPSWGVVDARDRATGESVTAWAARLLTEGWLAYQSTHVGFSAGMARMSDGGINGRSNRRPAMAACMPRAMGLPIAQNWGEYDLESLPPDVTIGDANDVTVEYDAGTDNTLNSIGAITLRTYTGNLGAYPTNAALPGAPSNIQLIPLRRVMNVGKKVQVAGQRSQLLKNFSVILPGAKSQTISGYAPLVPGDLDAQSILRINRTIGGDIYVALVGQGAAQAVVYKVRKTPISLGGGSYRLIGDLQIDAFITVVEFDGTSQFVSAAS